ncbi:hypothetical protein HAX54_042419 [Datura stramonium]|uniref:Uncharacterized protein n=1 Tax=Datura stramonium TaxID=4076 RepID=A0ABS8W139_DATST|nr:hypothetical protein [Datura stramonium]
MDTYDDIFFVLEPLFDGGEWDHRKISTNQIHKVDDKQSIPMTDQDEQKEVVTDAQKIIIEESDKELNKEIIDDDDVVKQENGVEIQKSEIILLDSKMDDEVIKKKREASAIETTNEPLVARRTNPRRVHRSTIDSPQELIRRKSKSKRERINAKDFILPDGWAIEISVRVKGNGSGHEDMVN